MNRDFKKKMNGIFVIIIFNNQETILLTSIKPTKMHTK